ncbi:MAG: hypothetical protein EOO16_00255 [Chitinophagaceae bacterium]|nr:MAG: hypothetical protein EOO16_00255 [Chitinophagaceae bacterium]
MEAESVVTLNKEGFKKMMVGLYYEYNTDLLQRYFGMLPWDSYRIFPEIIEDYWERCLAEPALLDSPTSSLHRSIVTVARRHIEDVRREGRIWRMGELLDPENLL